MDAVIELSFLKSDIINESFFESIENLFPSIDLITLPDREKLSFLFIINNILSLFLCVSANYTQYPKQIK